MPSIRAIDYVGSNLGRHRSLFLSELVSVSDMGKLTVYPPKSTKETAPGSCDHRPSMKAIVHWRSGLFFGFVRRCSHIVLHFRSRTKALL
jgi:hypothetical protein